MGRGRLSATWKSPSVQQAFVCLSSPLSLVCLPFFHFILSTFFPDFLLVVGLNNLISLIGSSGDGEIEEGRKRGGHQWMARLKDAHLQLNNVLCHLYLKWEGGDREENLEISCLKPVSDSLWAQPPFYYHHSLLFPVGSIIYGYTV